MTFDKGPLNILTYHQSMLTDRVRTECYRQAIFQTVRPGDVVVDLGAGTGILTCFACLAGAGRVYAIETGRVIALARLICNRNGFSDRVVFVNRLSTEVELPEPVDVLITETIGNFGLEEGILGYVIDARRRLLKKEGRILPVSLALDVVPVEQPELYRQIDQWNDPISGADVSPVRAMAVNNPHWVNLDPATFLSEPACLGELSLADIDDDDINSTVRCTINRAGTLHGVGGWFSAGLCESIRLTNAPPTQTPNWRHAFLPLANPLAVEPGDFVDITVQTSGNAGAWRWRVVCKHADASGVVREKAKFDQSSFFGQMLATADLHRRASGYRPVLGENGMADRAILQWMDGSQTVDEIARRVAAEFPSCFHSFEKALERVRQLSARSSR